MPKHVSFYPLPNDAKPQQIAAHFASDVSVDGKATGDAEKLVSFHRALYQQHQQLTAKCKDLQGEELARTQEQLSKLAVLYSSIQNFLNAAHKMQTGNQKPDATVEERRQALSSGTVAGKLMAGQLQEYAENYHDSLKDDPAYKAFSEAWKSPMTKGQDILFKVGLAAEPPKAEKQPEAPWPHIITVDELNRSGLQSDVNIDRLSTAIASIGFSAEDPAFKRALYGYASAMNGVTGTRILGPEGKAESLKTLATLPGFLKENYQKLASAADAREDYSKAQFDYDLSVLGKKLKLDLKELHLSDEMPERDKDPSERKWRQRAEKYANGKLDLDKAPRTLATILVCTMNAGKQVPFNDPRMNRDTDALLKTPAFQSIAKNPQRCIRLIQGRNYSEVFVGMSDPFASVPVEKQRETLEKLKTYKQAGFLSPTAGRSREWKNYWNAIDDIDLSKPETYAAQMKRVLDTGRDFMKGRTAQSSNLDRNARVDQCMDGLTLLSKASDYVRDQIEPIVERTNEVRTRWNRNQNTFDLDVNHSDGIEFVNKLFKAVELAESDPQVRQKLETDPRFAKLSVVHPENDNPAKDWEVMEPKDFPAKENGQPVIQ